jgi:hypothetical protein
MFRGGRQLSGELRRPLSGKPLPTVHSCEGLQDWARRNVSEWQVLLFSGTVPLAEANGHYLCYFNSVALSPQANYTDSSISTCWRNLMPTFAVRGMSRGQRGGTPTGIILSFLDGRRYFPFK